jgi:hypothetical protein
MDGSVLRMQETRMALKIVDGRSQKDETTWERTRCRWKGSIEVDFAEIDEHSSGLRSIGVTFPPHDSSDVGSNPVEVVEFLRTEEFREQFLREVL